MIETFRGWYNRYLSDPEAIFLLVLLAGIFLIFFSFGSTLVPLFCSLVIAYLLNNWMNFLIKYKVPAKLAGYIIYLAFLSMFSISIILLFPLLWKQFNTFITEWPSMLDKIKNISTEFASNGQTLLTKHHMDTIVSTLLGDMQSIGKLAFSVSLASIPGIITWLVYLVIVPLLVFFFIFDKQKLISWVLSFLPEQRGLLKKIWFEMDQQINNYIQGKFTEITIVGIATYIVFWYFELKYQLLLAVLVGLSVIIPYVGAVVVSIPVIVVGYMQWGLDGGLSGSLALMLYGYFIVQFLDGNILVPLLFSEAVNLHPVAIIVAILVFGAMWGFWGVFFAIPLATLVKSIINSWPKKV